MNNLSKTNLNSNSLSNRSIRINTTNASYAPLLKDNISSTSAPLLTLSKQLFSTVQKNSPALYWAGMFSFLFAFFSMIAMLFDERMLFGVNIWLKPVKFLLSTGIYLITVGYLITLYPYSKIKHKILTNMVAWTIFVDVGIVVVQAARGVPSHYNMSSPIDALLYAAMGILIGINVLLMFLFLMDTIRLKLKTTKAIQWSILLGWGIIIVGSWVGGQMIAQLSHTVGATDGGTGIPFLNWSTIAGDLRIAHFFGLHGLQILPLFALLISKKWNTSNSNQIMAVTIFGLSYAAWIAFTFYQAKLGMALIGM